MCFTNDDYLTIYTCHLGIRFSDKLILSQAEVTVVTEVCGIVPGLEAPLVLPRKWAEAQIHVHRLNFPD